MTKSINRIFESDDFLNDHLPGKSDAMGELRHKIMLLNKNFNRDLVRNVLIMGESGSGKNHLAKIIAAHRKWLHDKNNKTREDDDLNPTLNVGDRYAEINLPGLNENLMASELFGSREGGFTDAIDREGYFGEGYDDILLDEIGDVPMALQSKLLRVLNDGTFRPVGGGPKDDTTTNSRILMATNRNLVQMCEKGEFREDLLWRLREFVITVPPLKDQADAVEKIAGNILREIVTKRGLDTEMIDFDSTVSLETDNFKTTEYKIPKLPVADLDFARTYRWPGNIRQLHHALMRWLIDNCQKTLQDCALEIESEIVQLQSETSQIKDRIFEMLDNAAKGKQPVANTPNYFIESHYTQPAKEVLVEYIDQRNPRPRVLEAMFPEMKDANSIRSTIRKWRYK